MTKQMILADIDDQKSHDLSAKFDGAVGVDLCEVDNMTEVRGQRRAAPKLETLESK